MEPVQLVQLLLLIVAVESLLPALAPRRWQAMLQLLARVEPARVQNIALVLLALAVCLLLFVL